MNMSKLVFSMIFVFILLVSCGETPTSTDNRTIRPPYDSGTAEGIFGVKWGSSLDTVFENCNYDYYRDTNKALNALYYYDQADQYSAQYFSKPLYTEEHTREWVYDSLTQVITPFFERICTFIDTPSLKVILFYDSEIYGFYKISVDQIDAITIASILNNYPNTWSDTLYGWTVASNRYASDGIVLYELDIRSGLYKAGLVTVMPVLDSMRNAIDDSLNALRYPERWRDF